MYWKKLSEQTRTLVYSMFVLSVVVVALLYGASFNTADASNMDKSSSTESASPSVIFTNATAIPIADFSGGPGTGTPYPSNITVTGLGTITNVNIRLNGVTHTFPDDIDVLVVSPAGTALVIQSDAGGGTAITNRTYTFDQSAATQISSTVTPAEGSSVRPGNHSGNDTTTDVFPAPAPAAPHRNPGPQTGGTAGDLTAFNGQAANGTWSLYVTDDEAIDTGSINGGWTIDITAAAAVVTDAPVDFNGDGKTDFSVVRNTGGGPSGQITWFNQQNGSGAITGFLWGIATDFFVSGDFDADGKDDITVWRPGAATVATFYILNSATSTLRQEAFGQTGDDPTVVGDYNGDGRDDIAVYRAGASAGLQSTWFYRTVPNGAVTYVPWGISGDFPAPGDYDGNGSADFSVQRNNGGGQARFWTLLSTGATTSTVFGTPTDVIVPGDYDGDGKTDIATIRGSAGNINWYVLPSSTGVVSAIPFAVFGASATDFVTQGDYDGDGKTDAAIWRPSATPGASQFWYRNTTGGAVTAVSWGQNGDIPVANYNTH